MSLWVVRAGKHGEQEETAIEKHVVCHGWNELPDYSSYGTKDDLRTLYVNTYPDQSEKRIIAGLSQVWRFAREIKKGDLVALPFKTSSSFAFGRINARFREGLALAGRTMLVENVRVVFVAEIAQR